MMPTATAEDVRLPSNIVVERHEAKYVIPRSMVAGIRDFIRPFCSPDPNTRGDPPEYVITTLQLDTPNLSLHHAREHEALNRFKLRVRTYGLDGTSPVFVEIKHKIKSVISKSRARVPRDRWCRELILDPNRRLDIPFRSLKEEYAFLNFVRLVRQIGAQPTVFIRYTRESYISHVDEYARVTFDRRLLWRPAYGWSLADDGSRWRHMDVALAQNKDYLFSGVILELKAMSNVPAWLVELVQKFNLERTGYCKYSSAIWNELLFRGQGGLPRYATEIVQD